MSIQIDGNSPEYEAFVEKFKAKHSSDDTFTPKNIYETVREWAVRRYCIKPGTPIIRPFWPGGDYTKADYPPGCVVIDNPPFSILAKIVAWYNAHGVRFFLFAPSLTSITHCRDGKTSFVVTHVSIFFDNGAKVNTSFLTNMEPPDVLATTASDLLDALNVVNTANEAATKKNVTKLTLPNELITGCRMGYLAVHHTPFTVRRSDAMFVRRLDNYKECIFGGGYLLTPRAAAERAAAERAAAERAAAERAAAERAASERAAAHKIELSDREKNLIRNLSHNSKENENE